MKRQTLIVPILIVGILGLGTGFFVGPRIIRLLDSGSAGGHVSWASPVTTVAEQAKEADLIVRVRAESVGEPRMLTFGGGKQTEEIAQVEGYEVKIPFTDTRMHVLKVYRGAVSGETITVMQTGGVLPRTEDSPAQTTQLRGNPIFVAGTEYILFLKDISGDKVHASDRELYRIINPASRYEIQGEKVITHAEVQPGQKLPTTLEALLDEIRQVTDTK